MTDQYFVDQFKLNCINTHEKIEYAKEIEATLKDVKTRAEDLVHEVDIVSRFTNKQNKKANKKANKFTKF